jgi:hypothetical protein
MSVTTGLYRGHLRLDDRRIEPGRSLHGIDRSLYRDCRGHAACDCAHVRIPAMCALAITVGCSGATPAVSRAPDGGELRPATLVYAGVHEGDHPAWRYRQTVTIAAAERAGRPVWRRTARSDDGLVVTTLELDRQTLAPVHTELTWKDATMQLDHAPGRTTGVVERNGARRDVAHRHAEPVVLHDALDLWLAAQPLTVDRVERISVLEFWLIHEPGRYAVRPFTVRVLREEVVRVPAGEIATLVVALEPNDGDERLRSTYHLLKAPPHYAVRAEYIVNPVTQGNEKRSVGTEELVSIDPERPGAERADRALRGP